MQPQYRADIDGLRAIAVLAIVLFHLDIPPFSGGYVGVDIFFVISGYLITGIILRELAADRFTVAGFYERRVRRILPALAVVLVGTLLAGVLLLDPAGLAELGRSAAATSVFGSNIFFFLGAGYFAGPSEAKPLLHTWSLAVEEQFYILFPLLLLALARWQRARYARWLLGLTLASFLACMVMTRLDATTAFYLIPFRAWELLVGGLLAVPMLPVTRHALAREMQALLGLILVLVSVLAFTRATPFPGAAAALPVLGTALLIHAGSGEGTRTTRALGNRPMVFIGLISYSLYLWHWPLVVYAKLYLINEPGDVEKAVLLVAMLVLATLSWRFVERPFRDRQRLAARTRLFSTAAGVFALILAASLVLVASGGLPGRAQAGGLQTVVAGDPGWEHWKACEELGEREGVPLELCALGAADAPQDFLLWGDSHALALASAVNLSAERAGAAGRLAIRTACPPLLGIDRPGARSCADFNQAVLSHVEAHPELHTVVLAARWALSWHGSRYGEEEGSVVRLAEVGAPEVDQPANPELLAAGLQRTVAALEALGRRVVLVGQVPEVGHDVPAAAYAARFTGRDVEAMIAPTRAAYDARVAPTMALLESMRSARTEVLDPARLLCDAERCRVTLDGVPLYRDDNHLSLRGCVAVAAVFDGLFASRR